MSMTLQMRDGAWKMTARPKAMSMVRRIEIATGKAVVARTQPTSAQLKSHLSPSSTSKRTW